MLDGFFGQIFWTDFLTDFMSDFLKDCLTDFSDKFLKSLFERFLDRFFGLFEFHFKKTADFSCLFTFFFKDILNHNDFYHTLRIT